MALTVGELVAFASIDLKDFDRGLVDIVRGMKGMQSSTTSSLTSVESSVSRTFDQITSQLGDAFDPKEALADIERLMSGAAGEFDALERDAGQAGRRAGMSFVDEAKQVLRYGDLEVDIDADITEALAALHALEAAAVQSGERAGDGFVRGADGKLRDARGRFVAEGSTLFDGLVAGAERSGGLIGKALGSGLDVVGKSGPANLAILAGAIQALPTIAGVAAGGIVSALGGALLAVGVTNAASADRVQNAWKATADKIKDDLSDAAQPLEGSAIRAADVAEKTFQRLKPSLARIWRDLVPDVDLFVSKVGEGVGSLGPVLERLGDGFGIVLSELGDRMPTIAANLGDMLDTFSEMAAEDPQMLADLVEDASELLAVGADLLSWAGEIKAVLTAPSGPPIFDQLFGNRKTLADFKAEVQGVPAAVSDVGSAGDDAAAGVRNFSDALKELFDPAAAALDAEIRLKDALRDAAAAAKDKATTDIDRLRSVQDLTGAIADAATAEQERTGKTTEASAAFAAQRSTMLSLAGDNKTARDAIAALGTSLGITTVKTRDGTFAVDALGKTVQLLPNGKTTVISADTEKGKQQLAEIQRKIDGVKDKKVEVKAEVAKAVAEVKKVVAGLDGLKGEAEQAGKDVGSGLASGIRSMIGDAVAAAKSLAQSALDGAKDFLGIHSPSTVFADVGRWSVRGLIQGLTEEEGKAVDIAADMAKKIKDAFASQPDVADGLLVFVTKGNDSLAALAKQRDAIVAQLAAAKEMAKTVAGTAQEWADITGLKAEDFTGAGDIAAELQGKASAINNFANNIKQLAKMGLNKKVIQDIIDAGVEKGATFAEMLVGSDGSEIKALNKAQAAVDKASKKLGKASADAMFDVGKKSGDGYLKGLQESLKALDKEMAKIVAALVKAIKKELKIKSPSLVMAEIGGDTVAGLAVGLTDATSVAVAAMTGVAASVAAAAAGTGMASMGMGSLGMAAASLPGVGGASAGLGMMGVPYKTQTPAAGQAGAAGTTINVTLPDATIREEADVSKLGREIAFQVAVTP